MKEHCDEPVDVLDLVDHTAGQWGQQLPVAMYKATKELWQERKHRWNMSQVMYLLPCLLKLIFVHNPRYILFHFLILVGDNFYMNIICVMQALAEVRGWKT